MHGKYLICTIFFFIFLNCFLQQSIHKNSAIMCVNTFLWYKICLVLVGD